MTKPSPRRHRGQFKGNARTLGGPQPLTDVLGLHPLKVVRQGIRRAGARRPAAKKPLTERHLAVLCMLDEEPQGATALGRRLALVDRQVTSALYVLQARGLARRIARKGWVKDD